MVAEVDVPFLVFPVGLIDLQLLEVVTDRLCHCLVNNSCLEHDHNASDRPDGGPEMGHGHYILQFNMRLDRAFASLAK